MQIHIVKSGDSIWSISQFYRVSQEALTVANGLNEITSLVIGQALVIPSKEATYIVRPGDSLWSIARRFNSSIGAIARASGISPSMTLSPGMILRIPEKSKNFGFIESNAFIEASTTANETKLINEVGQYLTYLSPFSYMVNPNGSLIPMNDTNIITQGRKFRAAPLMVITNFKGGTFDTPLAHTILSSNSVSATLIENVITVMRQKGYYGLLIDFERVSPDDRELYNSFLRKVVAALHPLRYIVATALAPKTSSAQTGAWYGAHDYAAHGAIVDFVIIMTYEWGWSGGPPLPVAPINLVNQVIRYAVSVIPRKKIMMGMPLYGYDWILPYRTGNPFAKRVSPQQAINLAAKFGSNISFDTRAQSPHFNYYDERGIQHEVWFEDARSVRSKLLLANSYGLRGVSFWELGPSFPQNWYILDDMFQIVKVIR